MGKANYRRRGNGWSKASKSRTKSLGRNPVITYRLAIFEHSGRYGFPASITKRLKAAAPAKEKQAMCHSVSHDLIAERITTLLNGQYSADDVKKELEYICKSVYTLNL